MRMFRGDCHESEWTAWKNLPLVWVGTDQPGARENKNNRKQTRL
jgi:hypothetical protein